MLEVRRYESGLLSSNMYLIVEGDHAIVIDPCDDTLPAQGLQIDYLILTHEHYDHISGVNSWKKRFGAPVLCSKACAVNIQDPGKNLAKHFKEFCELQTWVKLDSIPASVTDYRCTADIVFEDETRFAWRGHSFFLFEIPGHSLGSIAIMLDDGMLFSGDSLLENTETELRLPGGSRRKWREIGAPRLAGIPDGVMVFPGHFKEFVFRRKGEN